MSDSLACSHSPLMHQKRMNYLQRELPRRFQAVSHRFLSVNAPTCAGFRTDLSPPVFPVIPKLLCPIVLIAARSGRAASVTSRH